MAGVVDTQERDKHGFFIGSDDVNSARDKAPSRREQARQLKVLRARELKWVKMGKEWARYTRDKPGKVRARCRKGIPDSVRGQAWREMCGGRQLQEARPSLFAKLDTATIGPEQAAHKFLAIIDRDLNRTYPHHELFSESTDIGSLGQTKLKRVLYAYAQFNPELGYTQGMGMVAGLLLMNMPVEDAFWCLVSLLSEPKYLKGMFEEGLAEVQICTAVFHQLLKLQFPALGQKMEREGMVPLLYATDWFMCAFVKTLPWDTVLRIWDMFLYEGRLIFFRVALAIMKQNQKRLMKECPSMEELMTTLRNLPPDTLLPTAFFPVYFSLKVKRDLSKRLMDQERAAHMAAHPPKPREEVKPAAALAVEEPAPTRNNVITVSPVKAAPQADGPQLVNVQAKLMPEQLNVQAKAMPEQLNVQAKAMPESGGGRPRLIRVASNEDQGVAKQQGTTPDEAASGNGLGSMEHRLSLVGSTTSLASKGSVGDWV